MSGHDENFHRVEQFTTSIKVKAQLSLRHEELEYSPQRTPQQRLDRRRPSKEDQDTLSPALSSSRRSAPSSRERSGTHDEDEAPLIFSKRKKKKKKSALSSNMEAPGRSVESTSTTAEGASSDPSDKSCYGAGGTFPAAPNRSPAAPNANSILKPTDCNGDELFHNVHDAIFNDPTKDKQTCSRGRLAIAILFTLAALLGLLCYADVLRGTLDASVRQTSARTSTEKELDFVWEAERQRRRVNISRSTSFTQRFAKGAEDSSEPPTCCGRDCAQDHEQSNELLGYCNDDDNGSAGVVSIAQPQTVGRPVAMKGKAGLKARPKQLPQPRAVLKGAVKDADATGAANKVNEQQKAAKAELEAKLKEKKEERAKMTRMLKDLQKERRHREARAAKENSPERIAKKVKVAHHEAKKARMKEKNKVTEIKNKMKPVEKENERLTKQIEKIKEAQQKNSKDPRVQKVKEEAAHLRMNEIAKTAEEIEDRFKQLKRAVEATQAELDSKKERLQELRSKVKAARGQ
ncbi:unnamed protein product [Amoebophrya sp. A25]|nr:unnamed protein product [Amoebophrya sp. A25]|eukprot:GSA25T00025813001.1